MNTRLVDKLFKIASPMCQAMSRRKKHCSVILYKGKVLSIGTNVFKTHPMAKMKGYKFEERHSELDAYLKIKTPQSGMILVNMRFNKDGELRMSRPCGHCLPWCLKSFDEIWYTTNDGLVLHINN